MMMIQDSKADVKRSAQSSGAAARLREHFLIGSFLTVSLFKGVYMANLIRTVLSDDKNCLNNPCIPISGSSALRGLAVKVATSYGVDGKYHMLT